VVKRFFPIFSTDEVAAFDLGAQGGNGHDARSNSLLASARVDKTNSRFPPKPKFECVAAADMSMAKPVASAIRRCGGATR
jgi:hypothetical protein